MLFVPQGNEFRWTLDSDGNDTRPSVTAMGTLITTNATIGTYSAWVDLISTPIDHDAYGIWICLSAFALSNTNRQALYDIGVDVNGGTSYQVVIPSLIGGQSTAQNSIYGGLYYYFPLFIPAGSTIGVRNISNVASAQSRVRVILYGNPVDPSVIKVGTKIEAIGIDAANYTGSNLFLRSSLAGAFWNELGTVSNDSWWFQLMATPNSTTTAQIVFHAKLFTGTNYNAVAGTLDPKEAIIENMLFAVTTQENIANLLTLPQGCKTIEAGTPLYVAALTSGVNASYRAAVYALT